MLPVIGAVLLSVALAQPARLEPLPEAQVAEAIELGRAGNIPVVQVGTFLGVSKGEFDVFIEGPVARIALAAAEAFRKYRPFDRTHVTAEMRAPLYRVVLQRSSSSRLSTVEHIVLQPRRVKGMDGVIQPVSEAKFPINEALFDRFPDGEFDVVVVTSSGAQKYNVTMKVRATIR